MALIASSLGNPLSIMAFASASRGIIAWRGFSVKPNWCKCLVSFILLYSLNSLLYLFSFFNNSRLRMGVSLLYKDLDKLLLFGRDGRGDGGFLFIV
jgi:hypothetical protein